VRAILRDVVARPGQIKQLARVAIDAFAARSEMVRVRELLGPHYGLVDPAVARVAGNAVLKPAR
jgi:hypothetical protein